MNAQWDDRFASGGKTKLKMKLKQARFRSGQENFGDFKCAHCHSYVSAESLLSGVRNRNHCPYCLWSHHLDLREAGDRLSACKAPKQAVGLAMKKTWKKYAAAGEGELMLVHLCSECGRVSLNRIAADDDVEALLAVFTNSLSMDARSRQQFERDGTSLLGEQDIEKVEAQLLGHHHPVLPRNVRAYELSENCVA